MEDERNFISNRVHECEENNCNSCSKFKGVVGANSDNCTKGDAEFSYKELFQKELTPSDVSKHCNRLLIPKKYAKEYFPQIQDEEMIFCDTSRVLWKFWYCYCKSSQSFLFTKGWYNFVKDKGLRAKDTIVFKLCESKKGTNENCNTFVIDVVKNTEVLPMDLALNQHQQEEIIDDHEVEMNEFTREKEETIDGHEVETNEFTRAKEETIDDHEVETNECTRAQEETIDDHEVETHEFTRAQEETIDGHEVETNEFTRAQEESIDDHEVETHEFTRAQEETIDDHEVETNEFTREQEETIDDHEVDTHEFTREQEETIDDHEVETHEFTRAQEETIDDHEVETNEFMREQEETIDDHEVETHEFTRAQEETIDDHEVETNEFTRAQEETIYAATALVPVYLFGKIIGWTEAKRQ